MFKHICIRNVSVSLSLKLTINKKVEHYIRMKTHKPIALRFLVKIGVHLLCVGWTHAQWY